jgi:hypothetical protein
MNDLVGCHQNGNVLRHPRLAVAPEQKNVSRLSVLRVNRNGTTANLLSHRQVKRLAGVVPLIGRKNPHLVERQDDNANTIKAVASAAGVRVATADKTLDHDDVVANVKQS